jgi:hypothetical protein
LCFVRTEKPGSARKGVEQMGKAEPLEITSNDILFLDYDGCLHPGEVWIQGTTIELNAPGHELFESAPVLEAMLAPYPTIRIVLSTSWVRIFCFAYARDRLPTALAQRVIGSTFDPAAPHAWRFDRLTRYDAIMEDVRRRRPARWLALDDDALGWEKADQHRLVLAPAALGLACERVQEDLRARLAAEFAPPPSLPV